MTWKRPGIVPENPPDNTGNLSGGHPADREVCVCFHVPLGKLAKYIRLENPRVCSQLSECYGAGTGCGWCIPFLEKIFEDVKANPDLLPVLDLSEEEYRLRRREYHKRINAQRMKDKRADEDEA